MAVVLCLQTHSSSLANEGPSCEFSGSHLKAGKSKCLLLPLRVPRTLTCFTQRTGPSGLSLAQGLYPLPHPHLPAHRALAGFPREQGQQYTRHEAPAEDVFLSSGMMGKPGAWKRLLSASGTCQPGVPDLFYHELQESKVFARHTGRVSCLPQDKTWAQ